MDGALRGAASFELVRFCPWPLPRASSTCSGGGSIFSEKSAFSLRLVRQPIVHATAWSRCDADRVRLIRCAAQQLSCIQYGRINPIRGVVCGAVVLMDEVLSAFVGLWDHKVDMAGKTLAQRVTAMML